MFHLKQPRERGVTLIETTIAAALSALFLGSLFSVNASSMQTIRMARESAAASQVLQQRVEALRIANWHQITDADWLKANLLNADAPGTDTLRAEQETLMLIPYGSSTPGNTTLTRNAGATAAITSRLNSLLAENAMKVVWTVNYTGAPNDKAVTRQVVTIIAKGGVAKW